MNDKYTSFVHHNIYRIEERKAIKNGQIERYIKIELSSDKFTIFCNHTLKYTYSLPLEITIYDEEILKAREEKNLRDKLIKKLNKLNIQKN